MSFEGVKVNQGQGGLNRSEASTDSVMALVAIVDGLPVGAAYNTVYELIEAADADEIGFTVAFDANESLLVRHSISEFFRLAPNGTLKFVATNKTSAKNFFESADAANMFRAHSDVKRIGFIYDTDKVGLDIAAEIAASQLFINNLFDDKIYLNGIYIEGRDISKNADTLRDLASPKVSFVIAQDPAIAVLDPVYAHYAAVGAVLGMRAARKVNENLGSVDIIKKPSARKGDSTYPLTDTLRGLWLTASLSDGTPVTSLTDAEKRDMTAGGYIYAGGFQGFPGIYFNGEPTCTLISSDYSTGENNGVWDKAALAIRLALLPKVRGWFQRNPTDGKLRDTAISDLENIGKKPLNVMVAAEEISGYTLSIPAGQNPNDQTPLNVKASVTLGAIIHLFDVDLSVN